MSKKLKMILFLTFVILVVFTVVTVYYESQKTCCAPKPKDKKSATLFSVDINGYYVTCVSNKTLSKRVNTSWKEVKEIIPKRQGGYYLDDTFVNFVPDNDLGCDYLSCIELPKSYTVELIEHKKIGDKPPPSNSSKAIDTIPVYKTIPLRGKIKIDIQHFSDSNCSSRKTFSAIVNK